ncbi:MAG: transcriptional repressor LexA [Deltaproteobacteria bacterium]|nr:transcriptional repressor LexA [Deltaproteobacteria bacterium]
MEKRSITQKGVGTKNPLTKAQTEILSYIQDRCSHAPTPPTYREIQKSFGYKAVGTVQDHVKALIQKGFLEKPIGRSRGLMPLNFSRPLVRRIPIYGEIAAGSPRDAEQLELGELDVGASVSANPTFALKVVGDSMIEAGILEGDLVIVQKVSRAKSNDIVVALLDNETTVKRYLEKNGKIWLVPENSKMKPIEVANRQFAIQGRVVGLQRKYG